MAIQCEICDSTNLLKQEGVFVCQDCGAKYTTEEIKKMVSGTASAPVPSPPALKKENPPIVKEEEKITKEPNSVKKEEIAQLLKWAETAYKEGNTDAGDTYLHKAISKDSIDPNVIKMCLKHGKEISRSTLKYMIEETPANEKTAAYEFAYDVLEKQGMTLGFPFAESDYERLYGHSGTAERLLKRTIPELKMEKFWDIDRLLTIHCKSAIRWMNEYQLPKADDERGLLADTNWGIVYGIINTDKYLKEVDMLIPSSLKEELYKAFCKACDTVLQGTFYITEKTDYRHFECLKITEELKIKTRELGEYQPAKAKEWKEAKKVQEKYKKLLEKIEADAIAAISAEKAKRNVAYWAEHPEEHSQLQSDKAQLEAKIRKLQNEHQANPQKKAMKQAQMDMNKYNYELQNCGIFQGKRKKELALLIEETQKKERECRVAFEKNTIDFERALKDLQSQLTEVNKKLNRE